MNDASAALGMLDHRLLLLADGRFPCGGHAHSAGLEPAVAGGSVGGLADLERFLLGWLHCGLEAEARFAAAAANTRSARDVPALAALDDLAEAAIASPALRRTGRRLGKTLLRTAANVWPHDRRLRGYLAAVSAGTAAGQHPVAMGAAAAACLGGENWAGAPGAAALLYCHSAVSGAAWAAVRLLPVDPAQIASLLARLAPSVAWAAGRAAGQDPLPAAFAPAHELGAEEHAGWEVRLFAS